MQFLVLQLQDLVALVQCLQHGIAGAGADVGGNRVDDALRAQACIIEKTAAEEEVRRRAEHRPGAGFGQRINLALFQVDRVAEQHLVRQEAVALVDIEIVAGFRVKLQRVGDLVLIFGQMGLDEAVRMFGNQRAGHLHLFRS